MKRLRAMVVMGLLLPALAVAQSLSKVAPLPTGLNLWGVSYTSPNELWIVGGSHTCFRSSDGGQTWEAVTMPGYASEPLYNVTFISPTLGFISGNSASYSTDVYRTSDGGASWQAVSSFPLGGSWYHIDFVSPTVGFMGSNGAIVKTTDGGVNWLIRSGYPDCPIMYGMDFLDANVGIVGGEQISTGLAGIFKTSDGGLTWQNKHTGYTNDAVFLTSQVAIADQGTGILRSSDGGETWTPTGAFINTGILDIEKIDSTTAVGVSGGGDVWLTTDGGYSWSLRWVGGGDLPEVFRVQFFDTLHGCVVGQAGSIVVTSDGGATWTRVNRGIGRDWNALAAFSDSHVLAVGHHGYVQSTEDAGAHWASTLLDGPTFGRDTAFSDVDILGPASAVVVGHWGAVFRTDDGGANWQDLSGTVSVDYYANAVKFTDSNNGWMVGWDYTAGAKSYVQRTTNGGFTWTRVDAVNGPSMDVNFVGQNGWILTGGLLLWRTTDGGSNWRQAILPLSSGSAPNCYQMAWGTASVGYVCGWDGYLIKSTDGGVTWAQLGSTEYGLVYLGTVANGPNEVWVCGARSGGGDAVVKRSLDGGATWQTWSLPGQYTTPYRMVRTSNHVYVGGYSGDIYRFDLAAQVAPTSYAIFRGTPVSGGLAQLLQSDNSYLILRPGAVLSSAESPASVILNGTSPTPGASGLSLTLEARVNTANLSERVEFWDYVASQWVIVGTTGAPQSDSAFTAVASSPERFVEAGTRALKARISWKASGPVLTYPWTVSIDQSVWNVAP